MAQDTSRDTPLLSENYGFGSGADGGGQPATAAARDAWSRTIRGALTHSGETSKALGDLCRLAPDFRPGQALRGLMCLIQGRGELVAGAEAVLRDLRTSAPCPEATRDAALTDALELWLAGKPLAAADRLDSDLARAPGCALTMKLSHSIRFMHGDAGGMRRALETARGAFGADHPAHGYVQGCLAFALEETGDYAAAERVGRAGVDHAPDDAWGIHAVAHVHEMTGRDDDGVRWLDDHPAGWAHCSNFGYHMWWHLALMRLERGETDAVLELYDTRIRAEHSDDYRDISNGASLLARLDLAGVDTGSRWEELADLAQARTTDDCLVFADLHYMLALTGGGRLGAARELLASLQVRARRDAGEMDRTARDAGVPAALGLQAFGSGNHAMAFHALSRARPDLQRVGGSHAQRDIFEQLTAEAALRSGHLADARRLLEERLKRRGGRDRFATVRLGLIDRLLATPSEVAAGHIAASSKLLPTGT